MFTFLISILVAALSDKPFYSLIHLEQDTKCAEEDIVNSIAQYKATSVWHSQGGSTQNDGPRYVDVREVQSLVGTNRQTASNHSDNPNFGSMANRRDVHTRLLAASETVQQSNNSGNANDIRCYTLPTHVQQQQVAPVQVGDPRKQQLIKKGSDGSPNITGDSNRITALDDLNRVTLERSTRAETTLLVRGTTNAAPNNHHNN